MDNNSFFKYIFVVVVIFLVAFTGYIIVKNKSESEDVTLDQISTTSTIQTDLRFAIAGFDTINPILSNNRNVQEITKIIYEPLVTLNENFKLEYCLAEEIAKTDSLTYVIKLRKDILWQNNEKFTVNDVKFTIDTIKSGISTIYSSNLQCVSGLEIIDEYTIKIMLHYEVDFFEYNLTFPIMCESYYAGEDFATSEKAPIGTGMFQVSSVESNIIKLAKNEKYWDTSKTPMVNEININLYNTIGEAYNAFKSGDIDIVTVKISNVEDYIGTIGYTKIEYKSRDYDFLSFNTAESVLSDSQVRKALSLIIDKDSLVASCLGSGYIASNFSLDMGNWLYTRDLNISSNTDQARQILEVAGWTYKNNTWQKNIDGKTTTLSFSLTVNSNNGTRVEVAKNIAEQFKNFGIPVTVSQLSAERYVDSLNNRNYECILAGLEVGFSPSLSTFFGNGNLANYTNAEVLEIMNIVSNTTEDNLLYENYNKLYEIYLEESPYIGLYRSTDSIICNQSLVGNIQPNSFNIYHNIEKWYRQ